MKTNGDAALDPAVFKDIVRKRDALFAETAKAVVGQREVLKLMIAAVFARGHCLLVGVPGLAKTLMVKSLAASMDLTFRRIQFTPDLMPADITGSEMLDEIDGKREFRFAQGPLFANVVLADEISRTPPKTQAALLEAMQERQVTVGQKTHLLPVPFFVIATRNPIEQEGTYELPEAQQDRFLFQIQVDYPSLSEEERILYLASKPDESAIYPALSADDIRSAQELTLETHISNALIKRIAKLTRASRPQDETAPGYIREYVDWGVGPRAGHALVVASKAWAALSGRPAVTPDDVISVAAPVMRHRFGINFSGRADNITPDELIKKLIADSFS